MHASELPTATQKHDQIVRNARVWVAQTFFGQMLKAMHNSPFKADWVSGGRGGEAFQGQLDEQLAQRMAKSHAGDRLVRSIVNKIEHTDVKHVKTDLRA